MLVEIYGLYDPETDELRYIGKAKDSQARLARHVYERRLDRPVCRWIWELYDRALIPKLKVLERVEQDEWERAERRHIAANKGPHLLNVADGGAMPSNGKPKRKANRQDPERREFIEYAWRVRQLKTVRTQAIKRGDFDAAYKIKFHLGLSGILCL